MALNIKDLGVKFYSSKSYSDALLLVNTEPGALCFVSDDTGNYIILDGKVFGDGTSGGGGGSGGHGDVISVNGKTGVVVLQLSDFPVATIDGQTVTLADYFNDEGAVVSNSFIVTEDVNGVPQTRVAINKNGIYINGNNVATQSWVQEYVRTHSAVTEEIQAQIDEAEQNAKDYTDSKLSSVYHVKGSVQNYAALTALTSTAEVGDVYNVVSSRGVIGDSSYTPPGTNYVFTQDKTWDPLGGTIDLSGYATKQETTSQINSAVTNANNYTDGKIQTLQTQVNANTTSISNLSGNVSSLQSTTSTHTSQIAQNTSDISQNTNNINNISTQLTWQ